MTANCRSKSTASFRGHGADDGAHGGLMPAVVLLMLVVSVEASAQTAKPGVTAQSVPTAAAAAVAPRPTDPVLPPGYLIGTDDVLSIMFWKDKDMSADAQVRP